MPVSQNKILYMEEKTATLNTDARALRVIRAVTGVMKAVTLAVVMLCMFFSARFTLRLVKEQQMHIIMSERTDHILLALDEEQFPNLAKHNDHD